MITYFFGLNFGLKHIQIVHMFTPYIISKLEQTFLRKVSPSLSFWFCKISQLMTDYNSKINFNLNKD
jgi:hypothetical protein